MLLIDTEFEQESGNSSKFPITYKDYLPLWQGLLNPENYALITQNMEVRTAALRCVVDEIITTCISLINTLNLNIKAKENSVFSDISLSQTIENESDFRIFLNLVDLYVEILPSIEHFLWPNNLQKFLYEIIKNSYKNPLISGFYKLANAVLASSGIFQDTNTQDLSTERYNLILQYLRFTLDAVAQYPQELQISCLQLVLNIPEIFVQSIVDRAVPAFKIAFTLGLTNYEIATTGLSALERWTENLRSDCPKDFIRELIPCLEMFLQSEKTSIHLLQDIEEKKLNRRKKVTLLKDDETVESLQNRILLFFGSIDNDIIIEFIHKKSLNTEATWQKKDLLKYPMPFPDMNLDVNLDAMLPRIIELVLSSGDRQTRVAASEVLHTIVAFMLGKTVHFLVSDPDRYANLYKILCPTLLRLGCDTDSVIMQLYHSLMVAITHWLSSRLMLNSRATIYLIDSFFDGLCDETNSSLREVSGIYLAEFVHWSIKQSSDQSRAGCSTNIDLIVQRIINFALNPSTSKRVAAAIAFNYLYKLLRENEEIVNIYWLDILYAFVKSLDGCDDSRIHDALRHVKRVIIAKSQIFNATFSRRRKPQEFKGVRLEDTAEWILTQCGSLDRKARIKYIDMFEIIAEASSNSAADFFLTYLSQDCTSRLEKIVVNDLSLDDDPIIAKGLRKLMRTLDLYTWIIRKKLVDFNVLFAADNSFNNLVFACMERFVSRFLSADISVVYESYNLQELVEVNTLRCETVIAVLDFVPLLIDLRATDKLFLLDHVFTDSLFTLVSTCLTKPQAIGFDSSNLQLAEALPAKLDCTVKSAMEKLPENLTKSMAKVFAIDIQKFQLDMIIIDQETDGNEMFVKGLILLHECGFLRMCDGCEEIVENSSGKIKKIFDLLKTRDLEQDVCFYPKPGVKTYLQRLVQLLLVDYKIETMETIMQLLLNTDTLYRSDRTTITHGEYFLSIFKDAIFQGSLRDFATTLTLLQNKIHSDPDNILRITEALILYLQRHRNKYRNILEDCMDLLMSKFNVFKREVNNLEHRENIFLNIYAIAVRLTRTPLEVIQKREIYSWILEEMTTCRNFKYKIRLLRDFLICLTNENDDNNIVLKVILKNLKRERTIITPADLPDSKIASPETIVCFQTLLKLLLVTKSSIVFDAIIMFSMGDGKLLCDDKVVKDLKLYYNSIKPASALKSLELAYKRFLDTIDTNERFDVLHYFLLPSFWHCDEQTIEEFFERNAKEIYTIIMQQPKQPQDMQQSNIIEDRKQLFVSKIGCYNLLTKMFAFLPIERIDSPDSPITVNSIGTTNENSPFSMRISKSTLSIRQLSAVEGDDTEILRFLHCAAYNCLISIISITKNETFYVALFAERRDKNQLIWENIIDTKRPYVLRQTPDASTKARKKLVNIRKTVKEKNNSEDKYSYIKSYDLATSTLSENISAYDLNAVNLRPTGEDKTNEIMSLTLHDDDLNRHECMLQICGLLTNILNTQKSRPSINDKLPEWMSQFRKSMSSKNTNVQLFLLKIILNVEEVFKPYAKYLLEPIINMIYQCLKEGPVNYVITDTLEMLVDSWHEVCVPTSEKEKNLAHLMFSFLLERGLAPQHKSNVKMNMIIIEMIVNAWHESLQIPEGLKLRMQNMDRHAVRLILIFLTNKMSSKVIDREDIWEYLQKCLNNWKEEEDTLLQSFEAVGLILRYSDNSDTNDIFEHRKTKIIEMSREIFRVMQTVNPSRLVKCVHALCKAYPDFTVEFYSFISTIQFKVERYNTAKCLQVFYLMIPKLSAVEIAKELNYLQFNGFLESKILSCEEICLQIIERVVPILETAHLLPLIKLAAPYAEHTFLEYRKISFDIFTKVYMKYVTDESCQFEIAQMMNISKTILLSKLLDPAEDLQKSALDFWSELTNAKENCSARLLDILDTYTPCIEKNYLQIMTLMLLQLTKKSTYYEKKMFEPLHNCTYNDHNISVSYKSRSYESRIPLFAPSVQASRLNQRFTQYTSVASSSSSSHDDLPLPETNSPQFEATFLGEPSVSSKSNVTSEERIFAVPKVPKVSRRFATLSETSATTQKKQGAKKWTEDEYLREYYARRHRSVKLYRKYRTGDFPDIEISHATVLGPMQQLIKRDPTICKSLIVSLIRSIVDQINDDSTKEKYCAKLSQKLTGILEKSGKGGAVIPAIFEIVFNVEELELPWKIVTRVAKSDGLFAQGALLLERSLISVKKDLEPPAKRPRIENTNETNTNRNKWMELAALYESMDDVDVVLSIFKGDMFSVHLRNASVSRSASEWFQALNFYGKAHNIETNAQIRDHCLQGSFECLSRLSNWQELEQQLETNVKPNYETLLHRDDKINPSWVAPWIFKVHTHRVMDLETNKAFKSAMQSYLNDAEKSQRLRELFGEEAAVIVSGDELERSRYFLNGSLEKLRNQWIHLSPLAVPRRSKSIVKLRGIRDIDSYLKIVESTDMVGSLRSLLNFWENSRPSSRDELLPWDDHLSYRTFFSIFLIPKIESQDREVTDLFDKLRTVRLEQMLKLVECALNQKNRNVAKIYGMRVSIELTPRDTELQSRRLLNRLRLRYLDAMTTHDPINSRKLYRSAWEKSHKILNEKTLNISQEADLRQLISQMATTLADISENRPEYFELLSEITSISRDIFTERIDFDSPAESLHYYSFTNLRECCKDASKIADNHLRLAKYCYEKITSVGADTEITREFVRATLKAMRFGSEEATHYFPCLLKEEFFADEETREIFKTESEKVEVWRFLVWQTQLVSHLKTSISDLVLPIIEKIIANYPNALVYTLRLTLDANPQLRNDPLICRLLEGISIGKQEFEDFMKAMQYVVQPELYLEYHLKELVKNLTNDNVKRVVDDLIGKVYPPVANNESSAIQGELYRKTIAHYKDEIERINDMSIGNVAPYVEQLVKRLKDSLKKRKDKNELEDYSPWLQEFLGRDIEVPGQYTGDRKPLPQYHAKIVKIESRVKVMQSIRRPIRITIVANNAKNYRFLVKFGEDLRLDQRFEQIFEVMNKTLKVDVACSQRRLSIDTYQVFPLSGSLGFIQWIDGTKTLREYIGFDLEEQEKLRIKEVEKTYEEWIKKAAPGKNLTVQYKEALLKYSAADVCAMMTRLSDSIGWDLLRRTFVLLSPSMESFMALRQNFTTTYATMCIAQWILGIGDRHLGNTLISIESGRSLGIDFGSALGGGVDQSIPELMPFRLSGQITGLLKPFSENDLMGATMIHVLRALRNGKGPLLACLNVFAHERLNWEEHVKKWSQETEDQSDGKVTYLDRWIAKIETVV